MKRADPNKKRRKDTPKKQIQPTRKQLDQIKSEISKEATDLAWLLVLAAVADEVGLTDDQICESAKRVDRYASYIDKHLARLEDIRKTVETKAGIKLKGWC